MIDQMILPLRCTRNNRGLLLVLFACCPLSQHAKVGVQFCSLTRKIKESENQSLKCVKLILLKTLRFNTKIKPFSNFSVVDFGVNFKFKQFVQNRVVEIRRLMKPHSGNTAPQNPGNSADICSSGSVACKLVANQIWWNGPDFTSGEPRVLTKCSREFH